MVQNSSAKNPTLMDLSSVERQQSGQQRRWEDIHSLNTFLQDILCFFILLSLGLVMVACILCFVVNVRYTATPQHSHSDKSTNMSRVITADVLAQQARFQGGPIWIRFFRCQKQQPQQEAKLEQVREPEQDVVGQGQEQHAKLEKHQPHFVPTYQPIDYSDLAGGDYVDKQSDSVAQPFPVDNFKRR
ncbi:uncharacterized protein [Drosophila kikkawai]|uniref:Uncharacterized protein n=1 Tax=Drosophila kikkawai TaxID=30033 RepID=A0A6P4JRF1_DROKI|nr:uncharacterized protein LOC108085406 [Drosophila kikkawai]